jgi:hypothetical protein
VVPFLLLLGLFAQDCREGQLRSDEFLANGQAIYTERAHFEADCRTPALEIRSYGSFAAGEALPKPAGARALDFVFSRVTARLVHASAVADYNRRRVCGLDSWALGEEIPITGLHCELGGQGLAWRVPVAGTARYGVYTLSASGAELFLGRLSPERDASAPERRPESWDFVPYKLVHLPVGEGR